MSPYQDKFDPPRCASTEIKGKAHPVLRERSSLLLNLQLIGARNNSLDSVGPLYSRCIYSGDRARPHCNSGAPSSSREGGFILNQGL